ncbi:RNA/RNP complex-1-interacting phosphatase homolog [Uranotaenia lowii]|uniref:RNA/RNP complex-1-interacting phosphatase homolog n=1 Tax=Uranotaenia lowii TaxID=190385 RepID=UPI002478BE0E|nr:RNA/RNP complex-1-interacting phosphatase homolog [Uranotaenia lowii]
MPKYPDRWLKYSNFGKQIEGTPFVALKVPLSKNYIQQRAEESFSPQDVMLQIPKLGLIIDLTFTTKYYKPNEFEREDVSYKKIFTRGHSVPERRLVNQFINVVKEFQLSDQAQDKVIGVHCTHGLNRTGYFICAYMVLVLGQDPSVAIQLFNKSRGHDMERQNYLNSIMSFIPLSYRTVETRKLPEDERCGSSNNVDDDWQFVERKKRKHPESWRSSHSWRNDHRSERNPESGRTSHSWRNDRSSAANPESWRSKHSRRNDHNSETNHNHEPTSSWRNKYKPYDSRFS